MHGLLNNLFTGNCNILNIPILSLSSPELAYYFTNIVIMFLFKLSVIYLLRHIPIFQKVEIKTKFSFFPLYYLKKTSNLPKNKTSGHHR